MYNSFGRFCDGLFTFGRYQFGGYIMMGLGLVLVLVFAYFIFKKGGISTSDNLESPIEILQKRYVNGDIDQAEFIEKKDILKNNK